MPRRTRSQLQGGGKSGDRERPLVRASRQQDEPRRPTRSSGTPPRRTARSMARPTVLWRPGDAVDETPPWRANGTLNQEVIDTDA